MKRIIVNADDYGHDLKLGVCDGILKAYKEGVLSSTTVLVGYPNKNKYVTPDQAKKLLNSGLPFGLHVRENPQKELERFLEIFGKMPTHLDAHRFKMYLPIYRKTFYNLARKHNLPIRKPAVPFPLEGIFDEGYRQINFPKDLKTTDFAVYQYLDTVPEFLKVLRNLKEGTTEIMAHVSVSAENPRFAHMTRQLAVVTDKLVREEIEKLEIKLISFADL